MSETLYAATNLRITPLAGHIGAQLDGVDVADEVGDEVVAGIRKAILERKVVFLRDQQLDYEHQVAFARRLGKLTRSHPIFSSPQGRPHLREFDSRHGTRANYWHTDLTFLDRPPAFALLRNVVAPSVGGDTIWANSATAYAKLPAELRELADRLRIVHSNDSDYTDATVVSGRNHYVSTIFEAEHPAVPVHPETGERFLLLGGFARRVVGYPPQTSRDLIRLLQEFVTIPENTVRWTWRPGDLAIWDNLATQHYAILDYGDAHRRNERVTVVGSVPVGIDGRSSVMVAGDAHDFNAE
jgi:alpha-ketoglutarate-dependent taurine dioxygenase